ncbi:MAG: hypothetical protein KDE48_10865 [Anaerolineales bacterium]|nr:hypothetical protein [Anaerolineales bacterium]
MDLLLIIIGGILLFYASRSKLDDGSLTQTGKTLRVLGIILFGLGLLFFTIGFVTSFANAL